MAQTIRSFSNCVVTDVVATPKPKEKGCWGIATVVNALITRFGRLKTDADVDAAFDLLDEEERLQAAAIKAQEEAYFGAFFAGSVD